MNHQCPFCLANGKLHIKGCPSQQIDFRAAKTVYEKGYTDGQQGKRMKPKMANNLTYQMGYNNGATALNEAK